jgi:hypothetical protein
MAPKHKKFAPGIAKKRSLIKLKDSKTMKLKINGGYCLRGACPFSLQLWFEDQE